MKKYYLLIALLSFTSIKASNNFIKVGIVHSLECKNIKYKGGNEEVVSSIINRWSRKLSATIPRALMMLFLAFVGKERMIVTLFSHNMRPSTPASTRDYHLHSSRSLSFEIKDVYDTGGNYEGRRFTRNDWNTSHRREFLASLSLLCDVIQPEKSSIPRGSLIFESDMYQIGSLANMIALSSDKVRIKKLAHDIKKNNYDFNHRLGYAISPADPGVLKSLYGISDNFGFCFVAKSVYINYEDENKRKRDLEEWVALAVKLRPGGKFGNNKVFDYIATDGQVYRHDAGAVSEFNKYYETFFPPNEPEEEEEEGGSESDFYA